MSYKESPEFKGYIQSHRWVNTQFGVVAKASFQEPFPPVAKKLTLQQGQQCLPQIKTLLDEWSIVAFESGKISGPGYHYVVDQTVGKECGEGFILFEGVTLS